MAISSPSRNRTLAIVAVALLSIAAGALLYLVRPESEHRAIERILKLTFPLAMVVIFAITILFRKRR